VFFDVPTAQLVHLWPSAPAYLPKAQLVHTEPTGSAAYLPAAQLVQSLAPTEE